VSVASAAPLLPSRGAEPEERASIPRHVLAELADALALLKACEVFDGSQRGDFAGLEAALSERALAAS